MRIIHNTSWRNGRKLGQELGSRDLATVATNGMERVDVLFRRVGQAGITDLHH